MLPIDKLTDSDVNTFYETNIKAKISMLDKIHLNILKIIFNLGLKNGSIDENENDNSDFHVSQSEPITYLSKEIKSHFECDNQLILICLHDLEVSGFILQTQSNSSKEWCYAITPLGRKAIKIM